MKNSTFFFFSFFFSFIPLHANDISISFGMANISFTENEVTPVANAIDAKELLQPVSDSMSLVMLDLKYNFLERPQKKVYLQVEVPVVSAGITGIFTAAVGADFYFMSYAKKLTTSFGTSEIIIASPFSLFGGFFVAASYMIYDTGLLEKSDVLFELGPRGGGTYQLLEKWSIRAELSASRGSGVATTTLNLRYFLGVSFSP